MPYIHPRGNPASRLWVIVQRPFPTDIPKGFLFSGGLGYVFDRMMKDAGIQEPFYVTSRAPNTDAPEAYINEAGELPQYKPPFILVLGEAAWHNLKELTPQKQQRSYKTQLSKYVGSLMHSSMSECGYPHYMMPLWGPEQLIKNWRERNVATYFDLQKLRVEIEYWREHGVLQPLPYRQLLYKDMCLDEIVAHIRRLKQEPIVSVDIETCYPKNGSEFLPHPGYPITIGLAKSAFWGMSINLFRESPKETVVLWRELDELLSTVPNLGQNYFGFDVHFLHALGFNIDLRSIQDTMLRHHLLWPELSHKLQFMTRQYTRETYYKDEGQGWNYKNLDSLRHYNCLDVCCTYEIWEQQEEELKERGMG